jgi:hypothetical protein
LATPLAQVKGHAIEALVGERSADEGRRRATTVFGWLAGGSLGLLANYGLFLAVGPSWPVVPTTFALFVVGCFGGMWVADRLGHQRGFKILGLTAGILVALAASLVVAVLMSQPG